jgi:hypothetical protein
MPAAALYICGFNGHFRISQYAVDNVHPKELSSGVPPHF